MEPISGPKQNIECGSPQNRGVKNPFENLVADALEDTQQTGSPLKKGRVTQGEVSKNPDYTYLENYFYNRPILDLNLPASYFGELKNGLPDGKGKLFDAKGDLIYEGEFYGGKVHGAGKLFTSKNTGIVHYKDGSYFEGKFEFINNMLEGKGKLFHPNGRLEYEGDFSRGIKHGIGILYRENSFRYEGEFKNGLLHGKGKIIDPSGKIIHEGEFSGGLPNGFGVSYCPNGAKYEGEFKNGHPHGKIKLFTSAGELQFEGLYKNGKQISGKETLKRGWIYEGEYQDDKKHGKGKLMHSSGKITYEGDFKSGIPEGIGKIYFSNGDSYDGYVKNRFAQNEFRPYPHGQGKMTYEAKNNSYEGEWVNGLRHGLGSLKGRSWELSGIWENDRIKCDALPQHLL